MFEIYNTNKNMDTDVYIKLNGDESSFEEEARKNLSLVLRTR